MRPRSPSTAAAVRRIRTALGWPATIHWMAPPHNHNISFSAPMARAALRRLVFDGRGGVSSEFRRLVLVCPPCCLALHPHRRRVRHGRLDRGGAVRGGTRDQGQGGGRSGGPPPSASCLGLLREWALLWGFGRAYRDELVAVEAAAASANPLLPGGWEGPALAASLLRRVTITMVARCRHRR